MSTLRVNYQSIWIENLNDKCQMKQSSMIKIGDFYLLGIFLKSDC